MVVSETTTIRPFWSTPELAQAGYPIFPINIDKEPSVAGGFYAATTDQSQIAAWIEAGRERHDVAFATGLPSLVVVIDADTPRTFEKMRARYGEPQVRTERGGHWYFRHPQDGKVSSTAIEPGLDRKADGGYAAVPPSRGRTWTNGIPDRLTLPVLPEELRGEERPRPHAAGQVGERIPDGMRNKELTSLAGSMRRRGMDEAEILAALEVTNARRCEPPLEADELQKIAASVSRYEPAGDVIAVAFNGRGNSQPHACFNLTDLGNAERFVAHHGENVRYCYPWRKWLVWTGLRWERDESGKVHRLAKGAVRGIYEEAAAAEDENRRKALAQHATRSEAEAKIRAMLELAKSEVPVSTDDLDADPWLLNCKNGTIDLRTGILQEHRREHLITKLAPVEYDPATQGPTWQATLERVLPNLEIRTFFKRLCGYALTGDTSEHVLPMLYGTGANGKSTTLNALLETLGDYGMQAAPDLLVAKRNSHPTELADLFGARLVASIEVEDGRRLAESLVKQLTGGDRVKARRMRQDFWEFTPTHKVLMAANHKPIVRGTDTAIWRRIRLIPFTETILPAEQDKKLPEKLKAELPGILSWAVEGCLEWQRSGLQAPDEVRKATGEYRSEMDVLGAFLKECCQRDPDTTVGVQDLYRAYQVWCEEGGERAEGKRKFSSQLKERGFESRRSGPNGSYEWQKLQLLNFWKSAICRKTEPSEEKLTINGSKAGPRGVIERGGSVSSVSSVEPSVLEDEHQTPVSFDAQPGESTTVKELRQRSDREDELTTFLAVLPQWFRDQAADTLRQGSPEPLVNALATAVVNELYGGPQRWREALPAIKEWLGREDA